MPKLSPSSLPKYRKHRATGQAVVTLAGCDNYLGPYGTAASKREYDRLVGEWIAAGRPTLPVAAVNDITVVEVTAAFMKHTRAYYVRDGKPTGTAETFAVERSRLG